MGFVSAACELLEPSKPSEGLGFRVFSPSQVVRIVWASAAIQTPAAAIFIKARQRVLVR